MTDEPPGKTSQLTRAYAELGLWPRSSLTEVRRQYHRLAKKWHPDRYSADPVGQSEAAQRMREVNLAYRAICDDFATRASLSHGSGESPHPESSRENPVASRAPDHRHPRRLARDQLAAVVEAVSHARSLLPDLQLHMRTAWNDRWNQVSAMLALVYVGLVAAATWGMPTSVGVWRAVPVPLAALLLLLVPLGMIWFGSPLQPTDWIPIPPLLYAPPPWFCYLHGHEMKTFLPT